MEILGYLSGFMLAIMVFSVIVQFVYAYALQSLAHKNEMSSLAETLAWLPILYLYPFIVCGGGSFPRFLIGAAGFLVGAIGLGVMAGMMGDEGGMMAIVIPVVGILAMLGMCFYFGRIFWRTAERRGLNGFIGLLSFVPIVNLFVYPYIAFHDGFAPVNKVGAGLGFLLIVGPSVAQYQMINVATTAMEAQMAEASENENGSMNELATLMQQAAATPTATAAIPMNNANNNWQTRAMQISMQLSMLEALDPSDATQAEEIQSQLAQIKQQFAAIESSLPDARAASLRQSLTIAELRLVEVDNPELVERGLGEVVERTPIPAAPAATSALGQIPPAPPAAPAQDTTFDPMRGFPVPDDMSCQAGTEQQGDPSGKLWCQVVGGSLKDGWLSDRHPNGELSLAGQYRDGLRQGVWTRWYENGSLRVQAEFAHGLQEGQLVAWDRDGDIAANLEFEAGEPVHR